MLCIFMERARKKDPLPESASVFMEISEREARELRLMGKALNSRLTSITMSNEKEFLAVATKDEVGQGWFALYVGRPDELSPEFWHPDKLRGDAILTIGICFRGGRREFILYFEHIDSKGEISVDAPSLPANEKSMDLVLDLASMWIDEWVARRSLQQTA